ncbi:MAG TPA: site-2 protease family protein [Terracidiphilus sp.]|nr:site-2 protease family protein [Terracidiphilus sp.]
MLEKQPEVNPDQQPENQPQKQSGSIHLGRVVGIDLFLHWSWFIVAIYEIQSRSGRYSSVLWNVFEYLALFLIVLLHEFGHALACRQVGGIANRIMLWPLGGVAYVDPPPRPGATLWSIAAGPLVNVALLPVFATIYSFATVHGWAYLAPNTYQLVWAVLTINKALLIFNLLPIYPLDGGQILRALLWFVLGRARSLMLVTVFSFAGVAAVIAFAVLKQSAWAFVIAIFMLLNCWGGLKHARAMLRAAKLPRRPGFACPSCGSGPPIGPFWICQQCSNPFDTFQSGGVCPTCSARGAATQCIDCGRSAPIEQWVTGRPATSPPVIEGIPQRQ